MTRPGRDVSRAETPYPLTNAACRPPRRSQAGHIGPLRVQRAERLGTGRLSSGLEHVTFITCSKHPCHSLLFDVPRLPLPRLDLFLFETTTSRFSLPATQRATDLLLLPLRYPPSRYHRIATFNDLLSPFRTNGLRGTTTELYRRYTTIDCEAQPRQCCCGLSSPWLASLPPPMLSYSLPRSAHTMLKSSRLFRSRVHP